MKGNFKKGFEKIAMAGHLSRHGAKYLTALAGTGALAGTHQLGRKKGKTEGAEKGIQIGAALGYRTGLQRGIEYGRANPKTDE